MFSPKEKEKHVHKFTPLAEGRVLCVCGELGRYNDKGEYERIKPGDPNYKDPVVPVAPFKGQIAQQVTKPAEKETEVAPEPVPLKPEGLMNIARYYLDNKDRIISDIKTLGRTEAGKRWDIQSGQLSFLLQRWGVEGITRTYKKRTKASPDTATPGIGIFTLLNTNRDAITHDYHMIGEERLLKKWAIPVDEWKKIKDKWGLLDEIGDPPAASKKPQEEAKEPEKGSGIENIVKMTDILGAVATLFTKPPVDPRSEAYLVGYQAGFEKGVKFGYELKP
jgi:hypothetical protein